MELKCRMSLLTPFELDNERSYIQCKYYLRDAWSSLTGPDKAGGMLVSAPISCSKKKHNAYFKIKGLKRKRYEELDDGYDEEPVHIVGLSMFNVMGKLMSRPMRIPSMFITTKCGIDYEKSSINMYLQLPLYGDLKYPLTMVSELHNHFGPNMIT